MTRSSRPRAACCSFPDLLAYWLTGAEGAEVTNASTTGLLDVRTRTWATDLAATLGIDADLLPAVREPGSTIGTVRPEVLTQIGHHGDLPVLAVGSHDTASAVVGVPAGAAGLGTASEGSGPDAGGGGSPTSPAARGRWSGSSSTRRCSPRRAASANFTNELGVDGTVRYLRNVMGLWVLQESIRTWDAAGLPADLADLLAAAAAGPGADDRRRPRRPDVPAAGRHAGPHRGGRGADGPDAAAVPGRDRPLHPRLPRARLPAGGAARRASSPGGEVDVVHVVGGGVPQRAARASSPPTRPGCPSWPARSRPRRWATCSSRRGRRACSTATSRRCGRSVRAGQELRRYTPGVLVRGEDRWTAAERRLRP